MRRCYPAVSVKTPLHHFMFFMFHWWKVSFVFSSWTKDREAYFLWKASIYLHVAISCVSITTLQFSKKCPNRTGPLKSSQAWEATSHSNSAERIIICVAVVHLVQFVCFNEKENQNFVSALTQKYYAVVYMCVSVCVCMMIDLIKCNIYIYIFN